jgi:aspartate dehydrogenase
METQRIALVGFGAIGQEVARLIKQEQSEGLRLVSVLKRELRGLPDHVMEEFGPIFTDNWEEVVSQRPDVLVEAAGIEAVRSYADKALSCGMDLVVSSVGALADDGFLSRLKRTASERGQRILLPSGAIGGLDALSAASLAGLSSVTHTIRKPPRALLSPERATEVQSKGEQVQLFDGSARESVIAFPQNTNVTAAVSLAGVGADETVVRVIADPNVSRNTHEVVARGTFGELALTIRNEPFPSNPKTSQLAAFSVAHLILARVSVLTIGG